MGKFNAALIASALAATPAVSFAETPSYDAAAENQITAGVFARLRWGAEDEDKTQGLAYGLALRADMACAAACAPNTRALELRAGETPSFWLDTPSGELRLEGEREDKRRDAAVAMYVVGGIVVVLLAYSVLADAVDETTDELLTPE